MKRVAQYDIDSGKLLAVWPSITEAARTMYGHLETNIANICRCCHGHGRTACGYRWEYYQFKASKREKERTWAKK